MNCDCNCNGKCKMLGGLEQQIMEVLWQSDKPLKPAEVLKNMKGDYAYTTIMTVLKRMFDKELVNRVSQGNAFYYSSCLCKSEFASGALEDLFARLFSTYGQDVVSAFDKAKKKFKF